MQIFVGMLGFALCRLLEMSKLLSPPALWEVFNPVEGFVVAYFDKLEFVTAVDALTLVLRLACAWL